MNDCVHYMIVDGDRVGVCKYCGRRVDYIEAQKKAGVYDWGKFNPSLYYLPNEIMPYIR